MSIPDFQSIMLPLLKFASDESEHTNRDAADALGKEFHVTDDERKQLLPSGTQPVFSNRVAWARSYLKMARLLENTGRGVFKITKLGQEALATHPPLINIKFLEQYEHFDLARHGIQAVPEVESDRTTRVKLTTPAENIETAYQEIRIALADDILQRIKVSPPSFFEKLVVDLLVKMGYGGTIKEAARTMRASGPDGGIDGIINEDRLGLDVIYVQAKRWQRTVGRPDIQQFAGALAGKHARKGVYITTSDFSPEAEKYVASLESKIVLISGEQVAQLMIDYRLGTRRVATYEVKEVDSDYFAED